jgi:uncharacterized protein
MKLKTALLVVLMLGISALARAEVSAEKRTEIDRMLKLTGMEKLLDQMATQMITGLRGSMKDVPPDFWDRFAKKVHGSDVLELLVPLYDKYYSLEDLRAVNAFYSSPAGQRMVSTLPQIMNESMVVGQKWGQKLGEEAAREAMAEKAAQK